MPDKTSHKADRTFRLTTDCLVRFLPIPVLLVIWEVVARTGIFNRELFPPPSAVWLAFVEMARRGELWTDVLASSRRAVVGYFFGCAVGVLAGILTGRLRLVDRALSPVVHILRAFPPVAIVPFAITWFGLSEASKYFLVFWGVFFPIWVNTHAGMAQVDRTYLWAAQSLGAGRRYLVTDVLLPAALPHILAGMRVAIGICFICVFVAEMAGAYEGIGFRISTSYLIFRVDRMLAALIVLGLMGAAADQLFKLLVAKMFPWTRLSENQ